MLAGNSFVRLAGSEELTNFSQQSPKMLKLASESFIHALLLFLGLVFKISHRVPLKFYSFVSNSLSYICHTQKQQKRKFKPRLKLNHNIYKSVAVCPTPAFQCNHF